MELKPSNSILIILLCITTLPPYSEWQTEPILARAAHMESLANLLVVLMTRRYYILSSYYNMCQVLTGDEYILKLISCRTRKESSVYSNRMVEVPTAA